LEAIECFDKAIQLYACYADAYKNKANCLLNLNEYDEALNNLNKALSYYPPNCTVSLNNNGNLIIFINNTN